ncbi:hypothetical protein TNCV_268591 [Trichonephila clavipes]|nr:hypothetical protein TNCV_268591 [Trichonephila clavipes]
MWKFWREGQLWYRPRHLTVVQNYQVSLQWTSRRFRMRRELNSEAIRRWFKVLRKYVREVTIMTLQLSFYVNARTFELQCLICINSAI